MALCVWGVLLRLKFGTDNVLDELHYDGPLYIMGGSTLVMSAGSIVARPLNA